MNLIDLNFNSQVLRLNYRDDADVSVFREIFKLREYRAGEEVVKTANHPIIDVGAHAGYFSLYCHVINPSALIFAVEPEPNNLDILAENLKENDVKNVKVIAGAIAGATGKRGLVVSSDSHNHTLGKGNDVRVWSLVDFCKQNKIANVSLLKMDIEGGEYEVFESLSSADYQLFKNVILEYHNYNGRNGKEIETMLRQNGFGVQVFPSKFDKTMGIIFANNKRTV